MNREYLWQVLDRVDDRHIAAAMRFEPRDPSALRERRTDMKRTHTYARRPVKRLALAALAAALVLALGVTAYAAGWLDSIFGQAARMINTNDGSEDRVEAAAEAVAESPQAPESQPLPAFDGSKLTLKESYYDGQGLLLGVDLDAARPDPVVGYEPDQALLERITEPNQTYQLYYSTREDLEEMRQSIEENYQGTADYDDLMAQIDRQEALLAAGDPDDLDVELDAGSITREQYDDIMALRSERAAGAGLHYESAIWLDAFLKQELTEEDYAEFWDILERDGGACVVIEDLYVGDHMLAEDDVDLAAMQTGVEGGAFVEAQSDAAGKGYLTADLPEALRDLDEIHVRLKVKGGPVYYYMTLDGRAYALHDQAEEQLVPFTIPNSAQ